MTVTSIGAARWKSSNGDPATHSPREALEEALRQIDSGELDPVHVIVAYATADDCTKNHGWLQGGKLRAFAQVGLMQYVTSLMVEN